MNRLLYAVVLSTLLPWWPCVAQQHQAQAHAQNKVSGDNEQPIPGAAPAINQPAPTECRDCNTSAEKKDSKGQLLPSFRRPEWVIVYVTAAYVLVSCLMFWTMQRQAKIARQTLIAQFRPKVLVRGGFVQNLECQTLEGPITGTVAIVIVNVGGTPAHIVDSFVAINFRTEDDPLKNGVHLEPKTLQPGEEWIFEINLPEDEALALANSRDEFYDWQSNPATHLGPFNASTKPVFLIGHIAYRDELGLTRSTKFQRTYRAENSGFGDASTNEYAD